MAAHQWLFVTLTLAAATLTLACTPTDSLTTEQMIDQAEVVLFAKVLNTYTHPTFNRAYTAELEVYCVLKATDDLHITSRFNLSEAGMIEGKCFNAEVHVGQDYVFTAYRNHNSIVPFETPMAGSPETIGRVSRLCGLNPRLPIGTLSSPRCPTTVDAQGCIIESNDVNVHDHDDHHDDHDHSQHHDGQDVGDHDHDVHHADHDHDVHHDDHDDHHDDHDHDDHHDDHDHNDEHHDGQDVGDHDHDEHHEDHDHHEHHDDHDHDEHHDDHDHDEHDHDHDHANDQQAQSDDGNLAADFKASTAFLCFTIGAALFL